MSKIQFPNLLSVDSTDTDAIIKAIANELYQRAYRTYPNMIRVDVLVFSAHEAFDVQVHLFDNSPLRRVYIFRESQVADKQVIGIVRTLRLLSTEETDEHGNYREFDRQLCYLEYRDGFVPRLIVNDANLAVAVLMGS